MSAAAVRRVPPSMAEVLRARGKLGPYETPAAVPAVERPGPSTAAVVEAAAVRAWAAAAGLKVAAHGPLPAAVLEQYRAAQAVG